MQEIQKNDKRIVIAIISAFGCVGTSLIMLHISQYSRVPAWAEIYWNQSLPVLIGLFMFPMVLCRMKIVSLSNGYLFQRDYITILLLIVLAGITIVKSFAGLQTALIVHTLIIAGTEEFLYRFFLLNESKSTSMIVVSSVIFAFILHNNEPFLMNLCLRLPMGLFLGLVFVKRKDLLSCVILHYVYNLTLS